MMRKIMLGTYDSDFDYCEEIIRRHSKSFYRAFSALDTEKAQCVYAIYAFCRLADDAIDEHNDWEELCRLETDLESFLGGSIPDTPVWRSLHVVFDAYDMNAQAFRDMIEGQKRDYSFVQPITQQDLEDYCYYVAGSVGLMLAPLLSARHTEWENEAICLGVAMQLTNILRDVGEDFENGRLYLPAECLHSNGYKLEDFESNLIDERFVNVWEDQAARAEYLYRVFERAVPLLDRDAVVPVLAASRLYAGILDAVRDNDYDCFSQRAVVSNDLSKRLMADAANLVAS